MPSIDVSDVALSEAVPGQLRERDLMLAELSAMAPSVSEPLAALARTGEVLSLIHI